MSFMTTWIDPDITMLIEISQMEKDKYHMTSLIHERQKQTNQTNSQKQRTDWGGVPEDRGERWTNG